MLMKEYQSIFRFQKPFALVQQDVRQIQQIFLFFYDFRTVTILKKLQLKLLPPMLLNRQKKVS